MAASSGPELRFDGRVAIVTGAGGGLGREYALLLASRGAKVVVNDLGGSLGGSGGSARPAEAVVEAITRAGGEAIADLHSVEEGSKIVDAAIAKWGRVDILINNAGILRDVSFHKMSQDDWDAVYRVHLRGSYAVTRAAWPHMRKQGYGRVVMASSAAGLYGNFGQANYASMKMALVGLANTLAIEGARKNIGVNVVCPVAASRMTETVLPEDLLAALRPDLVAPIVAYLCHEDCDDNGSVIECGAGWAGKLRRQRSRGAFFPEAQNKGARGFEMEQVAAQWKAINSFEDADYPETNQDAFGIILQHVEEARASKL